MVDLWDTLSTRRSVRCFQERQVPDELIRQALQFAMLAPSAHNAQPWRFVWIKDAERRHRLLKAMNERYISDMAKDGVSDAEQRRRARESFSRFGKVPVLLLACVTLSEMKHYPDPFRKECEKSMAIQSLGAALQNFLLAVCGLGLAGRLYGAPLFCPDIIRTLLELPEDYIPQAFVAVGYPSATPDRPERKALEEILWER